MEKRQEKIELTTDFTPYTLDTYNVFEFDEEHMIDDVKHTMIMNGIMILKTI
jgi:hypothetical protein